MSLSNLEITSDITGNVNFDSDFQKSAGCKAIIQQLGNMEDFSLGPVCSNILGEKMIFRVRMFRALDNLLSSKICICLNNKFRLK